METIQEGFLERCVSENKKEWKRNYFVFQCNLSSGSKTLEYFKDNSWRKQEPRGVCNLYSEFTVRPGGNEAKHRFTFELTTVDKTYLLGAATVAIRQRWLDVLLEASDVKSFKVTLIESPENAYDFVRYIVGASQLQISQSAVILVTPNSPTITWKFAMIRRYKSQNGAFVLEVGRRSQTGEGVFRFETSNPVLLFDVLEKAVKERIKSKGLHKLINNNNYNSPETLCVTPNAKHAPPPPPPNLKPRAQTVAPSNDQYSHIDTRQQQQPLGNARSEYDLLFQKKTHLNKRKSEPIVDSALSDVFNSSRTLTSKTLITPANIAVNYQDMSGQVDARALTPPVPTPRAKPVEKVVLELNNEYDLLFKSTTSPLTPEASEYNRLSHSDDHYRAPTPLTTSNVPAKPARTAPLYPPTYTKSTRNTRKVGGSVSSRLEQQPVYDCPKAPAGYLRVGTTVRGEYGKVEDQDGYVRVPGASDEMYQEPRKT